jgi:hypothetical protein
VSFIESGRLGGAETVADDPECYAWALRGYFYQHVQWTLLCDAFELFMVLLPWAREVSRVLCRYHGGAVGPAQAVGNGEDNPSSSPAKNSTSICERMQTLFCIFARFTSITG